MDADVASALQQIARNLAEINRRLVRLETLEGPKLTPGGAGGALFVDSLNVGAVTGAGAGQIFAASNIVLPNNVSYQAKDSGGTARNILSLGPANNLILQSGAAAAEVGLYDGAGTKVASFNTTLATLLAGLYLNNIVNCHLAMVDISALAAGANIQVDTGASGSISLIFVINSSDGTFAIYTLQGGVHATQEISDPSAKFTTVVGTATSTNIYWDAGTATYRLQNNLAAGAKNYRVLLFMNG